MCTPLVLLLILSIVADDNAAVYQVFLEHSDDIVKGITSGLSSMISVLYSEQLIDYDVHTNLTTVTGLGNLDKACRLIKAVETNMRSAPKASRVLLILCSALHDNVPALRHVADKIRSELGTVLSTQTVCNVYACRVC